jgi:hypothetical protein
MLMIATEAAAEGINLQFCSLVVNYDLLGIRSVSNSASDAVIATDKNSMLLSSIWLIKKIPLISVSMMFYGQNFVCSMVSLAQAMTC